MINIKEQINGINSQKDSELLSEYTEILSELVKR